MKLSEQLDQLERLLQDETEETSQESIGANFIRVARTLNDLELDEQSSVEHQNRVIQIRNQLLGRLEQEFATEIVPDRLYERQHQVNVTAIQDYLTAYELLGETSTVHDIISTSVIEPFAQDLLTKGNLDGKGKRGSCEGLAGIYSSFLKFIQQHFQPFLTLDLLGDAIWTPFQHLLSTRLSEIFKPGLPDIFHKNYTCSMQFIEELGLIRQHEATIAFESRWNLELYYQLRQQQMSQALENSNDLTASNIWDLMNRCLDSSVFIDRLGHKFVGLQLQLLQSYLSHCSEANLSLDMISEMKWLEEKVETVLKSEIIEKLNDIETAEIIQALYQEPLMKMHAITNECWLKVQDTLVKDCLKVLPALRTIKNQYQMTNKPAPTTHSTYVSNLLKPIEEFITPLDKSSQQLRQTLLDVFQHIGDEYLSLATEMLTSATELEDTLRARKTKPLPSNEERDTNKMRQQIYLDVSYLIRLVAETL